MSGLRLRFHIALMVTGLFNLVTALNAQTLTGTLLGTVTDSTQAAVTGVRISITEVNPNYLRSDLTNEEGFYVFANLDPGNYQIEAEHPGFRKVIRSGIDLTPNTTARIDVEL